MLDLDSLNREQLEAVLTTDGPLLVLAGAGSGKTRVITYRLAHLIERRVSPKHILCVTFTNKAAFEMRLRARNLVGKSLRGATMSTFHALGSKILRDNAERAGLRKGFTISDGSEQIGTLRRILRELRIDDRKFDPKKIMAFISRAKNAGLDATLFRERGGTIGAGTDMPDEEYRLATIESYERYERALRAQNVVDFDDLLLLTGRLLEQDLEVLNRLQRRWRYLMVDEYQDTNGAQFSLMKLIAGDRQNLCVVGDDDQSIYGWRGADIANILGFTKTFPSAKTIKLEQNYRSTGNILALANAIIEVNTQRHDKTLKPTAGPGDPVQLVAVEDEDAEAELVAKSLADLLGGGVLAKDVAVLFRSNVQSRPIELALRTAGVPYRVVGGMELFDRKEIKDFLAYLRLLDNPDDEQSLRRIINFPPRGIGDTSIERADSWARERDRPLSLGLDHIHEVPEVQPKAADAVTAFLAMMAEHRKVMGRRKPSTIAANLLAATGLEEALLEGSDSATSAGRRIENVREIIRQLDRYEKRIKKKAATLAAGGALAEEDADEVLIDDEEDEELDSAESATLGGFLADLALGSRDEGGSKDEREDQVVLSTIHAAKGLEWVHVFVVGAEEELLPHARTIGEEAGAIEEERRLAYVATTRARKHLTITWARTRTRFGRLMPRLRTRFLETLPEGAVELHEDELKVTRSPEEQEQRVRGFMADIRSKLGM